MRNKIVVCGMPRSGFGSIIKLLRFNKLNVNSEGSLPYKFDRNRLKKKLDSSDVFVGHYYLNYIEELLKIHKAKIIVLKRDRKEVMESIKSYKFNPYHQKKIDGAEGFPFHCKNIDTATGYYHEEYYKLINSMFKRYSNRFLLVNTKDLNSEEYLKKILDFCEIPESDHKIKIFKEK